MTTLILSPREPVRQGGALTQALLADLEPDELAQLAERLRPHLPQPKPSEDGWMSSREAAHYLGISVNALHKYTASRTIPFEQDCPGGKLWLRKSALDQWREGAGLTLVGS